MDSEVAMRTEKQMMYMVAAICCVAISCMSGCEGGGCNASTNNDLSSLPGFCYEILIANSEMATLDGIESYDPPDNNHRILILENSNLVDIDAIPPKITLRQIRDNPILSEVRMGQVSGPVEFERNHSLRSVEYSLGQDLLVSSNADPFLDDRLLVRGTSPIERVSIGCPFESCRMSSFGFSGFGDSVATLDERTNQEIPASVGPNMDEIVFDFSPKITVSEIGFGAVQHLTTLRALYDINVDGSVTIYNLPDLAEGEVEAYHQHLLSNGFTGEFTACGIPGYPECAF